jgi:uncharacterized protein YaaN involved in tellurite resistance
MSTKETSTLEQEKLRIPTVSDVKSELALSAPAAIKLADIDERNLDSRATEFVDELLNFTADDIDQQQSRKNSVEQMGFEVQKRAAKQSEMLRQPVKNLSKKGEDGGHVANALISLKVQVEELDPAKFNFEPGWFSRVLGQVPGVGTPMKRYFSKFESAQTVISAIIGSLENARDFQET